MMQHQQRHPAGTFPACRCGAEPRHIQARGSHSREAFDITRPTGTRHQLECRCGACTAWAPNLGTALREWTLHHADPAPPSNTQRARVRLLPRLKDHA